MHFDTKKSYHSKPYTSCVYMLLGDTAYVWFPLWYIRTQNPLIKCKAFCLNQKPAGLYYMSYSYKRVIFNSYFDNIYLLCCFCSLLECYSWIELNENTTGNPFGSCWFINVYNSFGLTVLRKWPKYVLKMDVLFVIAHVRHPQS